MLASIYWSGVCDTNDGSFCSSSKDFCWYSSSNDRQSSSSQNTSFSMSEWARSSVSETDDGYIYASLSQWGGYEPY